MHWEMQARVAIGSFYVLVKQQQTFGRRGAVLKLLQEHV